MNLQATRYLQAAASNPLWQQRHVFVLQLDIKNMGWCSVFESILRSVIF